MVGKPITISEALAGKIMALALFAGLILLIIASVWLASIFNVKLLFSSFPLVGGTVTSLSYVNLTSNYRNISGQGMVATIVLNGNAQNLTGFSASKLNGSYSGGTPVSITTRVSSYGYKLTYFQSPALYLYNYTLTLIPSVYFTFSCPFGFTCSQSLGNGGTVDTFTMFWIPLQSGSYIAPWQQQEAAYAQSCYASGGIPILLSLAQLNVAIGSFGAQYECAIIGSNKYAAIYQDNSFTSTYNATVTISNGTSSSTIGISDVNPNGYSPQTNVYVISAGIQNSGYNINQQNIPEILYLYGPNKYVSVNPFTVPQSLTGASSPSLPAGLLIPQYSSTYGIVYSNQTITNINNFNQQVQSFTFPSAGTAFANLNFAQFSAGNPVASLSLAATPTFYAVIQVIAPFKMLGIGIPVAQPTILSVSPNPLVFASAATQTATFAVQNKGSAAGPIYITGVCNNNAFSSQTTPVPIQPGQSGAIPIQLTAPINPNQAQASYSCAANAYSTAGLFKSPTFSFSLGVNPQCGSGSIYVNSTSNCAPIQPQGAGGVGNQTAQTCRFGYTLKNGVCVQNATCPVGYALNTTLNPPVCQPIQQPGLSLLTILLLVVLPILAIGSLLAYALLRKKRR